MRYCVCRVYSAAIRGGDDVVAAGSEIRGSGSGDALHEVEGDRCGSCRGVSTVLTSFGDWFAGVARSSS